MNRRLFVETTLSAATLLLPGSGLLAEATPLQDQIPVSGPDNPFGDTSRVRELGDAYLRIYPQENDVTTLKNFISDADLYNDTDQTISHEFAVGNTCVINGWILSQTEARQYALFAALAT